MVIYQDASELFSTLGQAIIPCLVRTTGGLGIPRWHVGVHPMLILPALIRLPMFLMVTAVAHSILIVGFRLETNCFSCWFTCSTGLVEPSLDPVFIEVVLHGSPNKVMNQPTQWQWLTKYSFTTYKQ